MKKQQNLPPEVQNLITVVLDTFSEEAMRLRDKSVLTAAKELLEGFFSVASQLGTKEHDRALVSLNQQLKSAEKYSKASRTNLKQRFVKVFKKPDRRFENELKMHRKKIKVGKQHTNPEIIKMQALTRDTITKDIEVASGVETLQNEINAGFLALDLRMHFGVYSRLWFQRSVSFIFKHTFIILTSVIIAGIGYSWVVSQGKTFISKTFNLNFYGIALVLILAGLFKEYILAKQIKSIRLKVERQLLFPVLYHVFHANVQGLLDETMSREVAPSIAARAMPNTPLEPSR